MVLWLFHSGGNPYAGLEINDKFVEMLKKGLRLDMPSACPKKVSVII